MSFVGTLATLGFATAGLGLVVTAPDIEADTVLITMAAGIDLGAAAGLVLGRDLTWSSGGPAWCGSAPWSVASWAGRLAPGRGDDGGSDFGRAAAGITLAGTWGGFALASHLTRDMRPDRHGAGLGVAGAF
jgi:hypothetical protein